jgi:hypothetical protein
MPQGSPRSLIRSYLLETTAAATSTTDVQEAIAALPQATAPAEDAANVSLARHRAVHAVLQLGAAAAPSHMPHRRARRRGPAMQQAGGPQPVRRVARDRASNHEVAPTPASPPAGCPGKETQPCSRRVAGWQRTRCRPGRAGARRSLRVHRRLQAACRCTPGPRSPARRCRSSLPRSHR